MTCRYVVAVGLVLAECDDSSCRQNQDNDYSKDELAVDN